MMNEDELVVVLDEDDGTQRFEVSPRIVVIYDLDAGEQPRFSMVRKYYQVDDQSLPLISDHQRILCGLEPRMHLPPTHRLSAEQFLAQVRLFAPSPHLVCRWVQEARPDQLAALTKDDLAGLLASEYAEAREMGIRLARLLS